MSKLREQMLVDFQLKGATLKTQKKYLREVSNFAKYFGKSPEELGEKEVKEYLVHLLEKRKLSKGTYKNYASAIKFLYKVTLKREDIAGNIRYPRVDKTLPCVFDLVEVKALLSAVKNLKHKAILTIMYTAGLRLSETACLIKRHRRGQAFLFWGFARTLPQINKWTNGTQINSIADTAMQKLGLSARAYKESLNFHAR
jgi:site-specific recombinase XerD